MKIVSMFILGCLYSIPMLAQQTVSTTGGNASGGGGTVSYTVGQVAYTTITDVTTGSVSQGVQQPYEISVVTSLEEAKNISLEFSVYPNPATDYLILKIDGDVETQCIASLHNINGSILQTIKVETNETTIPMQGYPSGTYFLKVAVTTQNIASPRVIKTFKIIKH